MPPRLALILCTAFVLFLLALERRISRGVSPAAWIPTLWLMAVNSKPLAIWFGVTGDNENGSGLDQLLLTGLAIAAMVVLAWRRFDWLGALRRHGWILALLGYMMVSTIWSDIGLVALRRWVRQLIVVLMALVVMSEAHPRWAMESVLRRFAYVLIPFSLVLIKYYPVWGVTYSYTGVTMWIGVTLHKNGFGSLCSISILFLLWARYRQWRESAPAPGRYQGWADISIILTALYMLTGAQKNSATVATTLGVGCATLLCLLLFRKTNPIIRQAVLLILVISSIGFGVAGPFLGGSNIASVSSDLGRDDTLTGRTVIWGQLMPVFERQPVLGSGFQSFWTTSRRELYVFSDAHNGYLDIMMDLGVVGLAFYSAWLLSCTRKLHHVTKTDYYWGSLAISCLVMTLVYNAAESTLNSLAVQLTAVLVLMSLVIPYEPIRASRRSYVQRSAVGLERTEASNVSVDDLAPEY
jgi:exopolysaccharide production protein ExoQ